MKRADSTLKQAVKAHMSSRVSVLGFAPVERFEGAPEGHHPEDICKNARTVIVYGISIPRGVLTSPTYNLHTLHRSYHTLYRHLDDLSLDLSYFIEESSNNQAVPVPSYAPMVFHNFEPWGILSLKHAAVQAGLGSFGRSGQIYHPRYGGLLRLGAVVTCADMPGDPMVEEDPCLADCTACCKACPTGALDGSGKFNKLACLGHTIKHAIYPLALKDKEGLQHIERVINTAGYDYWIACDECLKVCPKNRKRRDSAGKDE
jgi:epoxyqueuosine reductase